MEPMPSGISNTLQIMREDGYNVSAKVIEEYVDSLRSRLDSAERKLNSPELHDFASGVVLEAAHQRERWASQHDAGKTAFDWFWLVGYLAQKAASSQVAGDTEKALHHTISTAAALNNWHAQLLGASNMRPGLSAEKHHAIDASHSPTPTQGGTNG